MRACGVLLCLLGLAVLVTSQSVAQNQAVSVSSKVANALTPSAAAAICPIVYPVDENPSARGYQYAFYGNAFFINRDGYLITAAHVLHSFRNGGEPHILVQRVEAPPQMLKAEVVLEDREHDVAVLRATPNPFFGTAYRVSTLAPEATPVTRGESIVVAALRPKRRQPHSFETELEDRSAASVIDFQNSVLEKGLGETELVLPTRAPFLRMVLRSPWFEMIGRIRKSGSSLRTAKTHEKSSRQTVTFSVRSSGRRMDMKSRSFALSTGRAITKAKIQSRSITWKIANPTFFYRAALLPIAWFGRLTGA